MAGICSNLLLTCRSLLSVASGNSSTSQRIGGCVLQQLRGKKRPYVRPPRIKYPMWFLQKERAKYDEQLTKPNTEFVREIVHDTFGTPIEIGGVNTYDIKTPLRVEPMARGEWNVKSIRTGVIARKIGNYPLWTKDGKVVHTTLLQVVDNHVIKYIPPEEFHPIRTPYKCPSHKMNLGCLLVGAESADPQRFTKEYCGIFTKSGVMPKKILGRFLITPEAAVQPGTRLTACHFKPGQWVDVRGKTIYRDFQGVMKRWGFHGMPATHGQTKTHRRPGCIGGPKARVWPGKKLPGHMGNRFRITRGLQVLRINTKYNVLWVKSTGIPGETGSVVYIYDSQLYLKRNNHHRKPYFPTFYPEDLTEPLPEELFTDNIFNFDDPTIDLQSESK